MVLVDTSIWISLFRKQDTELGQKMWLLVSSNEAALCGQVWVEYLGGFRSADLRKKHEAYLQAFPFLETSKKTFEMAAHLLAQHPRLGAGDAIIVATAIEYKVPLYTLDKDFKDLSSRGLLLY